MFKTDSERKLSFSIEWLMILADLFVLCGICYFAYDVSYVFVLPFCLFVFVREMKNLIVKNTTRTVASSYQTNRLPYIYTRVLRFSLFTGVILFVLLVATAAPLSKIILFSKASTKDIRALTNALWIVSVLILIVLPLGVFDGIDYTLERFKDVKERYRDLFLYRMLTFVCVIIAKFTFTIGSLTFIYLTITSWIVSYGFILNTCYNKVKGMKRPQDSRPKQIARHIRRSVLTGIYDLFVEHIWYIINVCLFMFLADKLKFQTTLEQYASVLLGLVVFIDIQKLISIVQMSSHAQKSEKMTKVLVSMVFYTLPVGLFLLLVNPIVYQVFLFHPFASGSKVLYFVSASALCYMFAQGFCALLKREKAAGSVRIYHFVGLCVKVIGIYPLAMKFGAIGILASDILAFLTVIFLVVSRLYSLVGFDQKYVFKKSIYTLVASIAGYGGCVLLVFALAFDGYHPRYLLVLRDFVCMVVAFVGVYLMSGMLLRIWRYRR